MTKISLPTTTIPFILSILGILGLFCVIIGIIAGAIAHFSILTAWRVIFGTIFVLFVPGFIWSYVFFPNIKRQSNNENSLLFERPRCHVGGVEDQKEKPLDIIERITLSIALSLALGPLLIFFTNKLGLKINLWSVLAQILILIFSGFLTLYITKNRQQKNTTK